MTLRKRSRPIIRILALCGALLALTPSASASWKEQVLYSFQGIPDGSVPVGSVVFDKAGNLYGATTDGGSSSCQSIVQCGTVYQLTPPVQKGDTWIETVLYIFKGNASNDGATPAGGLVIDSAGNLYGTTAYGGTGNCVLLGTKMGCGAVFELSPPMQKGGAWTETVLYSFPSSTQGYLPRGDLVFDSAGNLYGATQFGGGKGNSCDSFYQYCGEVFKLSPPKQKGGAWAEKVLHSFAGGKDGAEPNGGLVLDSTGAVYGTTYFGGNEAACPGGVGGTGCGTVFKLIPPTRKGATWTEELLHLFNIQDGVAPAAGVIFDGSGNVYGTTYGGPQDRYGLVFQLEKPYRNSRLWKESVLYAFGDGNDGGYPAAGLVFDARGDLFGATTAGGGARRYGVIFQLAPPSRKGGTWADEPLYAFMGSPDGAHADSNLVFDKRGNLYGTTQWGGVGTTCQGGCGTVFEVSP